MRASHPGPCLVITGITVLLAVTAGALTMVSIGILALFTIAVLAGQLSIGWSNDWADAAADAASGRADKPLADGRLARRTVVLAALVALVLCFGLGLAIGAVTTAWLVPVVGGGWAYNAGLKATPLSGLAYVVGFAPLPGLAVSILPGHPLPRPWALAAAGLLGLGAHFANVLPDLAADRASGVRGLPQLLARRWTELSVRVVALVLLVVASALVAFAPGLAAGAFRQGLAAGAFEQGLAARRALVVAGFAVAVVLGASALRAHGRTPFRLAMAIAAIDVVMLTLAGGDLT